MANALARNAGGERFTPHPRQYFRHLFLESIRSLAQRDVKWSVYIYIYYFVKQQQFIDDNIMLRVAFGCLVWPIALRLYELTQHKMEHFGKNYLAVLNNIEQ